MRPEGWAAERSTWRRCPLSEHGLVLPVYTVTSKANFKTQILCILQLYCGKFVCTEAPVLLSQNPFL